MFRRLLLAIFALTAATASSVLELNQENFDRVIDTHEVILVKFYAPWCGHCKSLEPEYAAAASQLKEVASFAKVDCTVEPDLCDRFQIDGFPTLKIFRDGKDAEYSGELDEESLVKYMRRQTEPPVARLEADQIAAFSTSQRVVVIGFFSSLESPEAILFQEAAKHLRDHATFGATTSAQAASAAGAKIPGVVVFKQFDEGKAVYPGGFEEQEPLSAFIREQAAPLIDEVGPDNYARLVESSLPLAYVFVTPESRGAVAPILEPLAREFRRSVNFVYIDAIRYGGHAANLGLTSPKWPALSLHFHSSHLRYPFSGELTTEAVRTFITSVLAGSVKPYLKSQPVPASQGLVKEIVGSTFRSFLEQGQNLLVLFYAPWCAHCKAMAKDYEQLAASFASEPGLTIAQMDMVENELQGDQGFAIEGFPTLILFTKGGEIISYKGDRTLQDLKAFISSNLNRSSSSASSPSSPDPAPQAPPQPHHPSGAHSREEL